MPHTDPSVALVVISEIDRAQDALAEWLENPHAVADLAALSASPFPAAQASASLASQGGFLNLDTALGTAGNDSLSTAFQVTRIFGAAGDDLLTAGPGAGDIVLNGGSGSDALFGGAGNDILYGGPDRDRSDGGPGNDLIVASDGSDFIAGGFGFDTLSFGNWNQPMILALTSTGPAEPSGTEPLNSVENVIGGNAADTIQGGAAANIVFGSGGNDVIDGGGGADVLDGGDGADRLTGGPGADIFRFQTSRDDTVTDFRAAEGDHLQLVGTAADYSVAQGPDGLVIFDASANPVVTLSGIASLAAVTIDFVS